MGVPTLLRAALPSVPVVNQLPGIRKNPQGDPSGLSFTRTAVAGAGHVAAYAEVCGFPVKDTVPLTYPHLLAFPLHMEVMTSPEFPYPAIGTVHVENSVTGHRPVRVGETLQVTVRASGPHPHAKGSTVDFLTEVRADDELVWESTSVYLRRGASTGSTSEPVGARRELDLPPVDPGGIEWRLPGDLGRRYAAVSGDQNPIHLYPLTAKALGFPRQIAHGMWSKARCVAALENRLPEQVRVDVAFRKPILLPGAVSFGTERAHDGWSFSLSSAGGGAPHVLGRAASLH